MKLVMKFGGSSVGEGKKIRNVAEIVKHNSSSIVIVTSAMNGVTDQLLGIVEKARKGESSNAVLDTLQKRHEQAIVDAITKVEIRSRVKQEVLELFQRLKSIVESGTILKELTPRSKDYILSFGERLAAPILAGTLEDLGLRSLHLTGGEAGIITDDSFGEATPLMNMTRQKVKNTLEPILANGVIPVLTGFIGATQNGDISTIGRGGSDYSATIIGSCINADEVWIWTDVDGLMTADPKIVKNCRLIPQISYAEAAEMVILGAKAMHPRALEPATEKSIPIRIKNTFNPTANGTLISKDIIVKKGEIVKGIAAIKDVALINISGMSMVGMPGTAAKVFSILGGQGINVIMISQSISESNISLLVRKSQLAKGMNALELALLGRGSVKDISFEDDITAIAVIGAGMKGTHGVASRLFGAVAKKNINVRMIAQGSSELNISFVVGQKDCDETIRAIHDEFKLG
ncbi:MAG: aspartate kinase [Thaumarchaeota archaeon]|nr:aspartate kinase [Nitrososphaerota archaeon]